MKKMNGNMNEMTTDLNYVYRPRSQHSDSINDFLVHLNQSNFRFSPQLIRSDGVVDVLSFIEGDIMDLNLINSLEEHKYVLKALAHIINEFHRIGSTYDWTEKEYYLKYEGDYPLETMCHNDIAPYNTIAIGLELKAMIDFDTICPGPRIWDIVYAAYRFIGLGIERLNYQNVYDDAKLIEVRRILVEYFCQLTKLDANSDFFDILVQRLKSLLNLFDLEIKNNNLAFIKMKEEGHYEFYEQEIEYILKMY